MLSDPLFVALVARLGGVVEISAQEVASAEGLTVSGTRNPAGEIVLRLET